MHSEIELCDQTSIRMSVDLGTLHAVSVAGRGAKGVVFLVRSDSGESLALKAISRDRIEKKNKKDICAYRRIWLERDVLASLQHPLFPSLRGIVSTETIIGFLIDWCPGGNLTALRSRQTEQMFSDDTIRFYAAELVLALEYLHDRGIVYRDLKPENILIQESGHIMLVDFDLSVRLSAGPSPAPPPDALKKRRQGSRRILLPCFSFQNSGVSPETSEPARAESASSGSGKSNSFVGTEDYVAPEVIRGDGHDFAVDWWSLGVVLYEMLYGRTPFRGENQKVTFDRILRGEPELVGERTALRDLIRRLLEKEPGKRIGGEEIRRHAFFGGVDWERVLTVERAPFIPAGAEWEGEGDLGIDVEKRVEEIFSGVGRGEKKEGAEEGVRDCSKGGDFDVF